MVSPAEANHSPRTNRVRSEGGRFASLLAQKVVHPGGVKATVDMSRELSLRAKRYCLEHGNIPVRQLFLELMTAFLVEEGY